MHTQETEHGTESLGASAKSVAERASALVRLEMELAALELKRKLFALGAGIGLSLGAGLFLVFAARHTAVAGAGDPRGTADE